MFAMVLAIGLLVDDAIVVVENVERVMAEERPVAASEATRKSMGEITGALVGIALVLAAVFLPMAFFGGSTGVIYRQFSITIVSAMVLSVLVALILTPALCATILKRPRSDTAKRGFFGWFNRNFDRGNRGYIGVVRRAIRRPALSSAGVRRRASWCWRWCSCASRRGFLPDEDQGVMFAQVVGPPGATAVRTQKVLDEVATLPARREASNVVRRVRGERLQLRRASGRIPA